MVAPYTVIATPAPATTYSFKTYQGTAAGVRIATRLNLSSATLGIEFDRSVRFTSPLQMGRVRFTTGSILIDMTAEEVDLLGNGWYRVHVTTGGSSYYLLIGEIDYQPSGVTPPSELLDENGMIRIDLLPELVTPASVDAVMPLLIQNEESLTRANLNGVFLPRSEYNGAGGIDSTTIQTMISTTILAHEQDITPHSAYDEDVPSFTLLFNNKLI